MTRRIMGGCWAAPAATMHDIHAAYEIKRLVDGAVENADGKIDWSTLRIEGRIDRLGDTEVELLMFDLHVGFDV